MKIDLKKEFKTLYSAPSKAPVFVEVPALRYLMIDGTGDPNTAQSYADAVQALFSLSYGAKFLVKKSEVAVDYGVMPLEGLWWTDNWADFSLDDKSNWQWTAMIMQPEYVTAEVLQLARQKAEKKLGCSLSEARLDVLGEGRCAQILHLSPYAEEAPTISALHAFIAENSASLRGKHHEIYLSDPQRTKPERLKTIIRQPVGSAEHSG